MFFCKFEPRWWADLQERLSNIFNDSKMSKEGLFMLSIHAILI